MVEGGATVAMWWAELSVAGCCCSERYGLLGGGHIHGRRATDGIRTLSDETVGGPESNVARG